MFYLSEKFLCASQRNYIRIPLCFSFELNYRGGRRSCHLKNLDLIEAAVQADRVVVLVGNNDLGFSSLEESLENYWYFLATIGSEKFRIIGLMPRLDHAKSEVAKFNTKLREEFTWLYIPCKFVRQKDFAINDKAHLDLNRHGAVNFSRLVHFIVGILKH